MQTSPDYFDNISDEAIRSVFEKNWNTPTDIIATMAKLFDVPRSRMARRLRKVSHVDCNRGKSRKK